MRIRCWTKSLNISQGSRLEICNLKIKHWRFKIWSYLILNFWKCLSILLYLNNPVRFTLSTVYVLKGLANIFKLWKQGKTQATKLDSFIIASLWFQTSKSAFLALCALSSNFSHCKKISTISYHSTFRLGFKKDVLAKPSMTDNLV